MVDMNNSRIQTNHDPNGSHDCAVLAMELPIAIVVVTMSAYIRPGRTMTVRRRGSARRYCSASR